MPVEVRIRRQDFGVRRSLRGVEQRLGNLRPALSIMGEIGLTSIQQNFEEGGRPRKWKALKESTIRERRREGKWPGQILVRRGTGGGLLGSINYQVKGNKLVISAKKEYAAIHHFGGEAGKGKKVKIPKRKYMMLQKQDVREMREAIADYTLRGKRHALGAI